MSRIGKQPVTIPDKVDVKIDGSTVSVRGPLGELERTFRGVTFEEVDGQVRVHAADRTRQGGALWGLGRALLQNMVTGVSRGFERELQIVGVGYRADLKGRQLHLALGHSHPILYPLPDGVDCEVDKKMTAVKLKSIDKALLGQTAANIRAFRPPEPYKGKGVRYKGEHVRRKAGKAAK